jgi:hypothetical protein
MDLVSLLVKDMLNTDDISIHGKQVRYNEEAINLSISTIAQIRCS